MRRIVLFALPAVLLAVLLVVGLRQAGDEKGDVPKAGPLTREQVLAPLEGAPPKLAALHDAGSTLVPGGPAAYKAQLAALEGYPVVVNLWASWCGPCRFELPFVQRVAADLGKEVAFLGVDVGDDRAGATKTAREFFMPYPSIEDPKTRIRADLGAQGLPSTAFYTKDGKLEYLHQGAYTSAAKLREDVERYALKASS